MGSAGSAGSVSSADGAEPVLVYREGRAGHIVLNRPRALNALTHPMVRRIDAALDAFERDPDVAVVVLSGAGERGLCAGGDIRAIHEDARGDRTASPAFWRDEYRLNARVARCPKPYVALMDGIVMGGGIGVSAHGRFRVVTERSTLAMPETGIGFAPDVGGSLLLARAPGELGTHLALTASTADAGDALYCGLADHLVPTERLADFAKALADGVVEEAVERYAAPAPPSGLARHREWIDHCYAADTVEEILARLRAHPASPCPDSAADSTTGSGANSAGNGVGSGAGAERELGPAMAARSIEGKSPTGLKVALAQLRAARRLGALEPVLEREFRASCAALSSWDLVEGIRAQVIDKDRAPRWSPATLEEVSEERVAAYFAPPAGGDPRLGTPPTAP
ncbi:enoyl-CoA hydratase/isomerase family protein [Streptomyces sp. AJS327]|uniref:enoyl-CoA hydratase/isomerase family protein n=1 Tax=Streptomyces sp. AJS327 TaxID=2545265 RepID=UPI0015E05BD9|nr:enoyl-CoA hydratase/isomerase family protein [Streptomyces sp. AJS327]MBA0053345.1 enoyl-CoA hydratase/isomerase family protein [Streptomyces sp. AJS327]